jgi:hypothetical protein
MLKRYNAYKLHMNNMFISYLEYMYHLLVLLNWILIFTQVGKIQVTAFQSEGGHQHALPLATIAPVIDLDSSFSSSDNAFASHSASVEGMEQDTGDSRASKNNKV